MKVIKSTQSVDRKDGVLKTATLADVGVGKACVIVACNLTTKLKIRFAEMGLTPNTEVTVLRVAPLGDPIVIRARGYELCLRKDTATQFVVRPL